MRTRLTYIAIGLALMLGVSGTAEGAVKLTPTDPPVETGTRISSLPGDKVPAPSRQGGTWTAKVLIDTAVRSKPAGGKAIWNARTFTRVSRSAQHLMVLRSTKVDGNEWLKVRLPIRPNAAKGWIPRARVSLSRSPFYVEVDRSRRLVWVLRNGKVGSRFRIVVGESVTPTPLGLFALHDRVRQADPKGFIGPWAIHLTAHSNVLRRYDGGPGRIAFHGRDGASLLDPLGSARSHGCMRMNNRMIRAMTRLPMGTAVRVSS